MLRQSGVVWLRSSQQSKQPHSHALRRSASSAAGSSARAAFCSFSCKAPDAAAGFDMVRKAVIRINSDASGGQYELEQSGARTDQRFPECASQYASMRALSRPHQARSKDRNPDRDTAAQDGREGSRKMVSLVSFSCLIVLKNLFPAV